MDNKKIEKVTKLMTELVIEAYSSIETLTEIKSVFNNMLGDNSVLIKRNDAVTLLYLVNTLINNDIDDPRMGGQSTKENYNLKAALEDALNGN